MKLSVIAASALITIAAFGEDVTSVETSNTFGVMKVSCSAQKVIVCTPWVKALTADAIQLKDLVMTAGLEPDDSIILYTGKTGKVSDFKSWVLGENGEWQGVAVTDVNGTTLPGADEAIARGAGFWFVKKNFTAGATYDLYLYGQDTADAATSTVVANAYNLVANPKTEDVAITALSGVTPAVGDTIQVPNGAAPAKVYTYKNGAWGKSVKTQIGSTGQYKMAWQAITADEKIPAGQGFWYISKGGAGAIAW